MLRCFVNDCCLSRERTHHEPSPEGTGIVGNAVFVNAPCHKKLEQDVTLTVHLPRTRCLRCEKTFASRSKLFQHLRSEKHGVLTRPGSEFLVKCKTGPYSAALAHWQGLSSEARERLAKEVDDAGRSALHFLVSAATDQVRATDELDEVVALIRELVAHGADVSRTSRPDTLWPDAPEFACFEAATPLQMARAGQSATLATVFALLELHPEDSVESCGVCLDPYLLCCNAMYQLQGCGHKCCKNGLHNWFLVQVAEGATFETLKCPVETCAVTYADALAVLGKTDMKQLERQSLELALRKLPGFVWCPRCPFGGIMPEDSCNDAQCNSCNYHFCKFCKHGWAAHEGMSCQEFKMSGGLAMSDWLDKHTRQCPNCEVSIELTQGCSHMTCRLCKHQFCWLCLGSYVSGKYTMRPQDVLQKVTNANSTIPSHADTTVKCPCGRDVIGGIMRR